ncbi:MAG: DinB family protein [Dehalococcoidia bacterium]
MATKTEVIGGLEFLIQEAKRIGAPGSGLTEEQWAIQNHDDGGAWNNREVIAHIASVGAIVVPFMGALASAPEGADLMSGMDIDAMNAQNVTQRADKSVADLVAEIETTYKGVLEWARGVPDDVLAKKVSLGGHKDIPLGDQLFRMIILHGVGHIYSCYGASFFAGR